MTRRSKIAKIVPIVNPSWLPFRVCSNDHAQLTGMPYIFFKIKNCLNDDLFISCDDRIRKMLHNICISAVAIVTQVSDPWPVGLLFLNVTCLLGVHLGIIILEVLWVENRVDREMLDDR